MVLDSSSSEVLTVVKELACTIVDDRHATGVAAEGQRGAKEHVMTDLDLTGRRALVTGGAQGLGAGHGPGAGRGRRRGGDRRRAGRPRRQGGRPSLGDGATGSSTSTSPTTRAGRPRSPTTVGQLGGLDILVNNAGIEITSLLVDIDAGQARTHARGQRPRHRRSASSTRSAHASRAARPATAAASINVASVAATIAFPGIAVYSATKSGVDRLTRVAAAESGQLGYGVRVNCVYPGLVPTAMGTRLAGDCAELGLFGSPDEAVGAVVALTPSGRLGEVADMADAVVFLASDASRFVNGAGLPVDGGMGM